MIMIIAFITMLIDHIGYIFFPEYEWLRRIGRIAFPLFAWGIVRGYRYTRNKEEYAKRLFIMAFISQIPMWLNFGPDVYNIFFTLLFGLLSLGVYDSKNHWSIKILALLCLLAVSQFYNFDYGMYGVLSILLLHIFWQKKITVLYFFIFTGLYYCIDYTNMFISFDYQLYATLSIVLLYFTPIQKYDFKINKYFKYLFYPVHLVVLYIIQQYFL